MESKKAFNPLEILQVDANIKAKDLKKILMKLLKKYNTKKVSDEKKEEYEKKKIEINKAYDIIKNKDKFNSWLNTESKVGEIMAIPDAVLKNSSLSFIFYCLILGMCLPNFAYFKWKNMKNKNVHGVDFDTMEVFMNFFNEDLRKKNNFVLIRSLIYLLSQSKELSQYDFKNLEYVKDIVEHEYGFPLPDLKNINLGYLAIINHLFRLNKLNKKDHKYLISICFKLIDSMKYVAISKGYIDTLKNLFKLQAMFTQGIFDEEYYMLQFPYVEFKKIFLLKMQNEKINLDNLIVNEHQRAIAENVKNKMPKIKVEEFIAVVKNTGNEEEDSNDHDFILQTERSPKSNNAIYKIEKDSKVTIKVVISTTNNNLCVHSNVMNESIYNSWTAFITIDGYLNKDFVIISNENKKKEFYFDFYLSSKKNVCEVRLWILNGQYLCNDVDESIVLKYY
ncbi:preprotein translocase subunit sec63 [Vairimorpha apis BRL 01]|uniref:Preprotein translocase subunit sec63 n=1 Tax=Vairimorpha apis BRL 01 TaxID=1037528 RepID=T0MFG3_9MICR|nr:preprotein translocase subunit sec63 [Vairimorpha apis BRL 01]